MNREYHRWHSPSLNRTMELLVFGHAGARVIIFPTSRGKFYEWEDRGMMWTLRDHIESGGLQIFCVDSVDAESWYCNWAHPSGRAYRHAQYDGYLYNEVLPFTLSKNDNPFLITIGTSFGAYHAMNFGLKHADKVDRILTMSGMYDIRGFTDGYSDDYVYFNNPMQFMENAHGEFLDRVKRQDIIIVSGRDDRLHGSARAFSNLLWSKGVWHAFREWDGWAHDWPYWQKMILLYISGHD